MLTTASALLTGGRTLAWDEWRLLARAGIDLLAVDVALRLGGLRRASRWATSRDAPAGRRPAGGRRAPAAARYARWIGVGRPAPRRPRPLPAPVDRPPPLAEPGGAAERAADRRAARRPASCSAHAWVELDGQAVGEPAGAARRLRSPPRSGQRHHRRRRSGAMVVTRPGAAPVAWRAAPGFSPASVQGAPARWRLRHVRPARGERGRPAPAGGGPSRRRPGLDRPARLHRPGRAARRSRAAPLIFEQRCECPIHRRPPVRPRPPRPGRRLDLERARRPVPRPAGRAPGGRLPAAGRGRRRPGAADPRPGLRTRPAPPRLPALHGAAVVAAGEAFAFIGPAGQGKTTLAAAFLHRGAALLSDDILPLRATPDGTGTAGARRGRSWAAGAPLMKLWEPTVKGALDLTADLPVLSAAHLTEEAPDARRAGQRLPLATAPARLRALYVPQRFDPVSAGDAEIDHHAPGRARGASPVLMSQTYRVELLRPEEQAALLPLYARLSAAVAGASAALPQRIRAPGRRLRPRPGRRQGAR